MNFRMTANNIEWFWLINNRPYDEEYKDGSGIGLWDSFE
jgi:hypothetical protein